MNCHFYIVTLKSRKDRTLLINSQLSFGFKDDTQVPLHFHVSFTSTGLKKNSSVLYERIRKCNLSSHCYTLVPMTETQKITHQLWVFQDPARPYSSMQRCFTKRVPDQIVRNQTQELPRQFSVNCHSDTLTQLPMRETQPPKQSRTSKSFLANPEGKIDSTLETFSLSIKLSEILLLSIQRKYRTHRTFS